MKNINEWNGLYIFDYVRTRDTWIKEKSPSGILTSALLFIEIATKGREKFHAFIQRLGSKGISEKEIARISNTDLESDH